MNEGKVVQVIGPIIDIEFREGKLPNIYNAIKVQGEYSVGGEKLKIDLVTEVAMHTGDNTVAR